MMDKFTKAEAEGFLSVDCKGVTLDNLLERFPKIEESFNKLEKDVAEAFEFWTAKEPQAGSKNLGKIELVQRARRAGVGVTQSMKKDDILTEYFRHEWKQTDGYKLFEQAAKEFSSIRQRRNRLMALPQKLEEIIVECNKFQDDFLAGISDGLSRGASKVRQDGLRYLEVAWLFREAHRGLRELKEKKPHAEVVLSLFSQIQMAVMGTIPNNLSPTGIGMDHMAPLGGAKMLTSELRGLIPDEALPFIATEHTRF